MSVKKIYLVRHGQTDYNLNGIVQGSGIDSDLNGTGKSQGLSFFNTYKSIPFDRIYLSKLKRTYQSVQNFIDFGIPIEKHEELNEICWGTKEGERITPEEDKYYHDILSKWRSGEVHLPIEGGESPLEVQQKQREVLDIIKSRRTEKNILICMHGRAIRIILSLILETPLKDMDQYEHSNLCLYLLEFDGNTFNLVKSNDTTHIE